MQNCDVLIESIKLCSVFIAVPSLEFPGLVTNRRRFPSAPPPRKYTRFLPLPVEMPDVVKYERIQTAEADHYADDEQFKVATDGDNGSPETVTRIEIPNQRTKFSVAQATAATLVLILCYFCLSIGLTFYQRWLLGVRTNTRTLFAHNTPFMLAYLIYLIS